MARAQGTGTCGLWYGCCLHQNKTSGSSGGAIVKLLGDISVGLRQKTDKLLVIVDGDVGLGDHGGELADEDMSVDAYAAVCVLFLAAKFVLVKRLVLPLPKSLLGYDGARTWPM